MLAEHVADAATSDPRPLTWLRRVNPLVHWRKKATFHLAENKMDRYSPFGVPRYRRLPFSRCEAPTSAAGGSVETIRRDE